MMKTFYHSFLSLLLVLIPANVWAEEEEEAPRQIAYAGKYSLEFQIGSSQNLKGYSKLPDDGAAVLGAGVLQTMVGGRLTMFQDKHWGYFMEFYFSMRTTDNEQLYKKYKNLGIRNYDGSAAEKHCYMVDDIGSGNLMLGAMYRYDISRWSFRPRFGMGWRSFQDAENGVVFDQKNSLSEHTYHEYMSSLENRSKTSAHAYNAFVYSPGVQVCFTPHNRMFFHLDFSWMGTLSKLYQVNSYQVINERETIDTEGRFYWKQTEYPAETHRQRVSMGNFLNIRLGIGWNIGR